MLTTAGTFLAGLIHVGLQNYQAGRLVTRHRCRWRRSLRELNAGWPAENRHAAAH